MTLQEYRYFVAVAELKHFGQAASVCCVSQPTLSLQLKKLEKSLGVSLFERNRKQVFLTEVGQNILEHARSMLQHQKDILAITEKARDPLSMNISLGLIPTVAPYLLPEIMPPLNQRLPQLELYLSEKQTHLLLKDLHEGRIDAAILALPLTEPHLIIESFLKEKFFLTVYPDHPLAKKKKVKMADLLDEKLLLLSDGHCLRDQTLDICARIGATENAAYQATSLETLRHMVAGARHGITLLPAMAVKHNDGLVHRPFINPQPQRHLALVWRESSIKKDALQKLVQELKSIVSDKKHTHSI